MAGGEGRLFVNWSVATRNEIRTRLSSWKLITPALRLRLGTMALGVCTAASGQVPVISSFSQNRELVCTNLWPGKVAKAGKSLLRRYGKYSDCLSTVVGRRTRAVKGEAP